MMWPTLDTRVPPPLALLACGLVGWLAARWLPAANLMQWDLGPAAGVVAGFGLLLNLLPKLQFRQARTTVNPLVPDRASALVTNGIYRCSRNPMYLGQACLLLGWSLWLQNAIALLTVPAFMLYITRFQIKPEERVLADKFPDAFAAFSLRTRRWL